MSSQPIHHADFTIEACALSLRLNGYPVIQTGAQQRYNIAPPVNFWLVGTGNLLEATLHALDSPKGAVGVELGRLEKPAV